jgi:hypothetical protein
MAVDLGDDCDLDMIVHAIREQKCILFLGAGAHAKPPEGSLFEYPPEHRPPVGKDLSVELAARCDLAKRHPQEDSSNLSRVATFYENKYSRHQLVEVVKQKVQANTQPSPMLRALAELAFPLVITTNFDSLFERALYSAGKQPRVTVYSPGSETPTDDPPDPTSASPLVRKLHGDISHPETLVLTDEDYIEFIMRLGDREPYDPIPLRLKFYLSTWPTLFVGYSLMDYNLRLLYTTLRRKLDRANVPDMYSVDVAPDPLLLEIWHKQRNWVKFIAKDVWKFVPDLYERVLNKELQP